MRFARLLLVCGAPPVLGLPQLDLNNLLTSNAGPVIAEYEVKDKKQVADFDPLAWIQEQEQQEEIDQPCPICGTQEDEDQLLLCDACNAPYHTYCLDPPLDHIPEGNWFCYECRDDAGNAQGAAESEPGRPAAVTSRRNRTLAQLRQSRSRRRVRQGAWENTWNQIASRVHEATGYDLDFDGQDELQEYRLAQHAHNRTSREQRELREWEQRMQIANRQGAGREFRSNILGRPGPVHAAPAPPPQETDDERRAWATYERERQRQEQNSSRTSPSRKRKATESPREPQAPSEPERKLKRPRTRRNRPQDNAGSSSEHAEAAAAAPNGHTTQQTSTPRRSPPRTIPAPAPPAPSFLSSLLKEVEESCKGDHGDSDTPHTNGASPGIEHSSPILSPSTSNYSTPRPLSLTPPPRGSGSPRQTSLSSIVEPIYPIPNPADYSPNRPVPQRSAGPSTPPLAISPPTAGNTSPGLSLRHPQPLRNSSHRALSPTSPSSPQPPQHLSHLSDEDTVKRKEAIRIMVKIALDSRWREKLSNEQYTTVNRKVCRKMYEKVPDLNLLSENENARWRKVAGREVESCAVQLGYASAATNANVGSGSGSTGFATGSGTGNANHTENAKPQKARKGVTA